MKEEKEKISWNDKIINSVSNNIVWIFLVFIIVVIIIPNLFARLTLFPFIKDDGKGLAPNEIGDAIGGMTAPIIGLFSAFLVYIAFRAQIKANEELQEFNKKQLNVIDFDKFTKLLERIESKHDKIQLEDVDYCENNKHYHTSYNAIRHLFTALTIHKHENFPIYHFEEQINIIEDIYLSIFIFFNSIDNSTNLSIEEKLYFLHTFKNYNISFDEDDFIASLNDYSDNEKSYLYIGIEQIYNKVEIFRNEYRKLESKYK